MYCGRRRWESHIWHYWQFVTAFQLIITQSLFLPLSPIILSPAGSYPIILSSSIRSSMRFYLMNFIISHYDIIYKKITSPKRLCCPQGDLPSQCVFSPLFWWRSLQMPGWKYGETFFLCWTISKIWFFWDPQLWMDCTNLSHQVGMVAHSSRLNVYGPPSSRGLHNVTAVSRFIFHLNS